MKPRFLNIAIAISIGAVFFGAVSLKKTGPSGPSAIVANMR